MYSVNNYTISISAAKYISEYRDVSRFIVYCRECNKYNNCWACPPYDFDTDKYISGYDRVYIIGTKILISEKARSACLDGNDSKRLGAEIIANVRTTLDKQLLQMETDIEHSKAFFAGTCHICKQEDCTRIINEPCRYPERIRHSLESFGFDIGKTAEELLGIELQWSKNGLMPEYITLVSGLFTNCNIHDADRYLRGE